MVIQSVPLTRRLVPALLAAAVLIGNNPPVPPDYLDPQVQMMCLVLLPLLNKPSDNHRICLTHSGIPSSLPGEASGEPRELMFSPSCTP